MDPIAEWLGRNAKRVDYKSWSRISQRRLAPEGAEAVQGPQRGELWTDLNSAMLVPWEVCI